MEPSNTFDGKTEEELNNAITLYKKQSTDICKILHGMTRAKYPEAYSSQDNYNPATGEMLDFNKEYNEKYKELDMITKNMEKMIDYMKSKNMKCVGF